MLGDDYHDHDATLNMYHFIQYVPVRAIIISQVHNLTTCNVDCILNSLMDSTVIHFILIHFQGVGSSLK